MPIFNAGIERIVARTNGSWQSIIPTSAKTAWTIRDSEERRIRPIASLRKIIGSHLNSPITMPPSGITSRSRGSDTSGIEPQRAS
jgi:hypothetical protein